MAPCPWNAGMKTLDRGDEANHHRATESCTDGARPRVDAVSGCPGRPPLDSADARAEISSRVLSIVSGTSV